MVKQQRVRLDPPDALGAHADQVALQNQLAAEMVEAIVKDSGRVLPVAAWVTGQYGLNEMFIGVPVKLGAGGIQETIELSLNDAEKATMAQSGAAVQELLDAYEAIKNAA